MRVEPYGTYAPGPLTRLILALSQNTWLGRGKARKLMAACVRRLNPEKIDARLFGQNMRLHVHGNSSEIKALMNPGRYSRNEFAFCRKHMPERGGVFVDAGANAGLFSAYVSSLMKDGTLIAAEPQPDLHARLVANLIEANPGNAERLNLHLMCTALGAHSGELELFIPDQLGQASAHAQVDGQTLEVPVCPLDMLVEKAGVKAINVLKIDVEGYEDQVLSPFFETAKELLWPRAIVIEHCHRDRWTVDCEALLLARGYRVEDRDRTNLMLIRDGG